MKTIASAISWLISGTATIAGIMVLMLVAHVTIDVVMRFVFETPLNSTILYVSAFYMVGIAFLPLAAVEQRDSHIAVELLVEKFPTKVQSFLAGLALLLTCIVTATVAIRTGDEAIAKYMGGAFSIEAGGKVITWPTYLPLPIGFGLMSIVAGWKFVCHMTGRPHGLDALRIEDPYLSDGDTK
ncbi:TRAP transporter small permease [uncultured Sulfitobacter sp.]|uniref:TRAP transporter small permease n=1 Tax=uncultured Sulfitobacter sp. TaxID=191468 RepID=UPI00260C88F5|nr:TRAP transporter small permease [uncultured Sulfitobacter sp.]